MILRNNSCNWLKQQTGGHHELLSEIDIEMIN